MVDDLAPDTQDWTWVLTRQCPECGLDAGRHDPTDVARIIAGPIAQLRRLLEDSADAGIRPDPATWSAVEYGAHLRDVCILFRTRLRAMLLHAGPTYADWDQNQAAIDGGYRELSGQQVADELKTASQDLLRDIDALTHTELDRTGRRSDGMEFTVTTLLQYFGHEVVHHWWDVSGQRAVPGAASG